MDIVVGKIHAGMTHYARLFFLIDQPYSHIELQWIVNPTADNYARIPSMMKPIKPQRLIPHSPALDLCPQ